MFKSAYLTHSIIQVNDALQIFYPNFGEKYYEKLQENWNLLHEDLMLRNDFGKLTTKNLLY